ncbi:MAG: hypothetical protein CR984_04230 [Proteobacteria bacterium]|nr:MAG: hypothetical protein CR984_04230 [Pseudomonadota bacterium]
MVPRYKKRLQTLKSAIRCAHWQRHLGAILLLIGILTGCATPPEHVPDAPQTLAVWKIEDAGIPGASLADTSELLTARVLETAGTIDNYELVERERLLTVLEELNLGSSQLANPATGLRIGRLVGARLMLFGSYQVVATQMRIDLRLVEVETSRVRNTAQRVVPAGNMPAWLAGAEAATRQLLMY